VGIYTCLLFIHHCFSHSLPSKPTFQLACKGKSVLHWLWNPCMTSPSEPHYDLLSGTCQLLECGYSIQLTHIKGHQDNGEITVLTCAATLNIEADSLAKDKLSLYVTRPTMYYLPFVYGACYVDRHHIIKNIQLVLCNHINGFPAIKYWQ